MAQLYLKGVYYDTDSEGLWYLDNSGTYQEISVGSSSYLVKTYAEMQSLIASEGLVEGGTYLISNATHSQSPIQVDLGIIIQAISDDGLAMNGTGIFLNADYQAVGDYSGVTGFAAQKGQWTTTIDGAVVDNDVVIWNKLHYLVSDAGAVDGTDPETNTDAYTLLPKSDENVGYIEEYDYVEYNLNDDFLSAWLDKRGNEVRQSFSDFQNWGDDAYDLFQWGNDNVWDNKQKSGAFYMKNNAGEIYLNTCEGESAIDATTNMGSVYKNVCFAGAYIDASSQKSDGGVDNNSVISGTINAPNNEYSVAGNTINPGSTLNANTNAGTVNLNILNNSVITANMNANKSLVRGTFLNITSTIDATKDVSNQTIVGLTQYADNAAAVTGGLIVGAQYRVTGTGEINVVI